MASLVVLLGAAAPAGAHHRYHPLERFALSLLNCTRTGGWVLRDGSCRGYGSGRYSAYRRPLSLHSGISDDVARPWARKIARADYCGHSLSGSTIDGRFWKAGYRSGIDGESVGCGWGYTVRRMVIRTHRMFQSEKDWNGWHWRNIKDRDWSTVGIGVVKVDGQERVVYDFYHP